MAVFVVYAAGAALTLAVDMGMYRRRSREHGAGGRLTLLTGLCAVRHPGHPPHAWEIWRAEVPWMTLYFSIGVWTSLAMVMLQWPARP